MRVLPVAFVVSVLVVTAGAAEPEESWTGQNVTITRPAVRASSHPDFGPPADLGEFRGTVVAVLDERGDWLRVHHLGHEWGRVRSHVRGRGTWLRKADGVPVRDAVAYFTAKLRAEPGDASHYHRRAVAWKYQKEYDKALADYAEAVRLAPDDPALRSGRGDVLTDAGRYAEAVREHDAALRISPDFPAAISGRGLARTYTREFDAAVADLTRFIRLDPEYAWGYTLRGTVWVDRGKFDKAVKDFDQAIRLDPADRPMSSRGITGAS